MPEPIKTPKKTVNKQASNRRWAKFNPDLIVEHLKLNGPKKASQVISELNIGQDTAYLNLARLVEQKRLCDKQRAEVIVWNPRLNIWIKQVPCKLYQVCNCTQGEQKCLNK